MWPMTESRQSADRMKPPKAMLWSTLTPAPACLLPWAPSGLPRHDTGFLEGIKYTQSLLQPCHGLVRPRWGFFAMGAPTGCPQHGTTHTIPETLTQLQTATKVVSGVLSGIGHP